MRNISLCLYPLRDRFIAKPDSIRTDNSYYNSVEEYCYNSLYHRRSFHGEILKTTEWMDLDESFL